MYSESPTDTISLITQLPSDIIVHDMAFDQTGTKVAIACSDKTVQIYRKVKDGWTIQSLIKLVGGAGWKVKWAKQQEAGVFLGVCTLDRAVSVYEWALLKKEGKQRYEWSQIFRIPGFFVEDFKFAPGSALGSAIGIVDSSGKFLFKCFGVIQTKSYPTKEANVSILGLNCLSWYKKIFDNKLFLAFGGKSHETTPLRALEGFKDTPNGQKNKIQPILTISFYVIFSLNGSVTLQKINAVGFTEKRAVNDISWAQNNGRSYNMLGVATDYSVKIYQVNFKQTNQLNNFKAEASRIINVTQSGCYRICWNMFGTYLAVSQRKKMRVFKSVSRGIWKQFKQVEDT